MILTYIKDLERMDIQNRMPRIKAVGLLMTMKDLRFFLCRFHQESLINLWIGSEWEEITLLVDSGTFHFSLMHKPKDI